MRKTNRRKWCSYFLQWLIGVCMAGFILLTGTAGAEEPYVFIEGAYTEDNLALLIYMDTQAYEIISAGVRVSYDPNQLSVIRVKKNEIIWFIGDGEATFPYMPPDTSAPGEIVMILGRIDLSDPAGIRGNRVLLGEVEFKRKEHAMPPDLIVNLERARGGTYSNFVTSDGIVLDNKINFGSLQIGPGGNTAQRGDADGGGTIDPNDVTTVADYLKQGGDMHERMDCNDDGHINVWDIACIQNVLK